MSRNKEKSDSALHRFQLEQRRQAGVLESNPNLRPKFVQKEQSLPQAEKWRSVVMTEISTRLTRIQDPLLEDYELRELNETINKLFREQRAWEYHIKSLGGPDYIKFGKDLQSTGLWDPGLSSIKGFRYFGRAKELPEVKELREIQKDDALKQKSDGAKYKEETDLLEEKFQTLKPFYYESLAPSDIYHQITSQVTSAVDDRTVLNELNEVSSVKKYDFDKIDTALLKTMRQEAKDATQDLKAKAEDIIDYETLPTTDDVKTYIIEKKREELLSKYS